MTTIRFSAPATVFDFRIDEDNPSVVQDPDVLKSLSGLEHDEVFSDYIADDGDETLTLAGVSGGRLSFFYNTERRQLWGFTEYTAPRALSSSELAMLQEYTTGQWSDGIGDNFYQDRMSEGLAPRLTDDDDAVLVEQRS